MPLPGTKPPPVFVTLMKSAPARTCSRTARGSSRGSSTSRPTKYMWPPVVVMTLPLSSSRGPLRDPEADGLAEPVDHAMAGAAVAERGDARPQGGVGMVGGADGGGQIVVFERVRHHAVAGAAGQVGMAVDQAGHDGAVRDVEARDRAFEDPDVAFPSGRHDPVPLHQDRAPVDGRADRVP